MDMNMERAFQDLGIDAVTGVELMDLLQVSTDELQSPQRFSRLKEVIAYFKQFPPETQRFLVNKATRGKMVDKLDHLYEYTKLLEAKAQTEQALKAIDTERSAVETAGDEILLREVAQRQMDTRQRLAKITEETYLYE